MDTLALAKPQVHHDESPTESASAVDTSQSIVTVAIPFIFSLDHDILLHIFHLNTHTPETEYCVHSKKATPQCPINTACHTSQVCRSWRQILLGSPAIWGSVVDMKIIDNSSKMWAEEVMKRTGGSDLSIYGWLGHTQRSRAFFASLLADHWHRVRRLDVVVQNPEWISDKTWNSIFSRPAPILEKFVIRGGDHIAAVVPKANVHTGPMLANSAPLLRRVHCTIIELDYKTAWMSQLLSVTLSSPLTTTEVLRILCTTVCLESLVVEDTVSNPVKDANWNTRIHLPYLRRLHIVGTVSQALVYLQNIVSHPDCALILQAKEDVESFSAYQLGLLSNIIAPYAARYFDIYKPHNLVVFAGYLTFDLQSKADTDMVYFAHPATRLGCQIMSRMSHLHITHSLDPILSNLASLSLGRITEFEFFNSRASWIDADDPNFITFITSLTSVLTLTIEPYTLKLLNDIRLSSSLIFPHLTTVQLKASSTLALSFPRELVLFLSRRKVAGVPVVTLDISGLVGVQIGYSWSFLDEVGGLEVVCRRNSEEVVYVCGSRKKGVPDWN